MSQLEELTKESFHTWKASSTEEKYEYIERYSKKYNLFIE